MVSVNTTSYGFGTAEVVLGDLHLREDDRGMRDDDVAMRVR